MLLLYYCAVGFTIVIVNKADTSVLDAFTKIIIYLRYILKNVFNRSIIGLSYINLSSIQQDKYAAYILMSGYSITLNSNDLKLKYLIF